MINNGVLDDKVPQKYCSSLEVSNQRSFPFIKVNIHICYAFLTPIHMYIRYEAGGAKSDASGVHPYVRVCEFDICYALSGQCRLKVVS